MEKFERTVKEMVEGRKVNKLEELVKVWREAADVYHTQAEASRSHGKDALQNQVYCGAYQNCADSLERALATAPPEQAAKRYSDDNDEDSLPAYSSPPEQAIEEYTKEMIEAMEERSKQPQAASGEVQSRSVQRRIALQKGEPVPTFGGASGGARNQNYLDDLRHDLQDEEFRFQYLAACATDSEGALRNGIKDVLEAALAAHNQKVRAEGQDEVLNELSTELAEAVRNDLIRRGQREPASRAAPPAP